MINKTNFKILVENSIDRHKEVLFAKNADYANSNEDCLMNFKGISNKLSISIYKLIYIYMSKHLDALSSFVVNGQTESEPILSRFDDIHNYLYLMEAAIEDAPSDGEINDMYNEFNKKIQ